jgi:hypothetical protein
MAYIKISDPKIIDLPTIHQIINVVNQHSDNISALTNNFGSILSGPSTANNTTQYQYDMSSQQIFYGVTSFNSSSTWSKSYNEYTTSVTFALPFGVTPIVTATIHTSGQTALATGTGASNPFQNLITRTFPDSTTPLAKVNIVLKNPTLASSDTGFIKSGSVFVHWIAIGHK